MTKRLTTEQRLTPARLEAISKRAEAATEGPWRRAMYKVRGGDMNYEMADPPRIVDAEFIAGAREDIPALLAEVERLRTVLAFYADESNNDYFADYPDSYLTESAVMEDNGDKAREAIRND